MFVRVWRFVVRPEHEAAFVRFNADGGEWARLFARAEGYLGTTLEPVADAPHTYRTRDLWRSAEDFAAFRARFDTEYRAMDAHVEGWTTLETLEFEGLPADAPGGP